MAMAAIVRCAVAKSISISKTKEVLAAKFSTCVVRNGGERKKVNTVKRHHSIKQQIWREWDVSKLIEAECPFFTDERFLSDDFEVLESLLKDLRKFNRENFDKRRKDADSILQRKRMIQALILDGRCRRNGGPYDTDEELKAKDVDLKIAHRTILNYNKQQHLNLSFARVVSVKRNPLPPRRNLVVEAYNPDAARVPMKLEATYSQALPKLYKIKASLPVAFMRVKQVGRDAERRIDGVGVEPLLFANLKNCPIIKKRLGLKKDENKDNDVYELVCDLVSRGQVVKLPKDDDTINSIASSAVKQQRKRLRFVRVTKAWLERIPKDQHVYHIMLEATKAKVKTVYYAAVMTNGGKRKKGKCIDWVAADSPRATMPLPG
ncbi:Protease HtpX-like protein [Bienertia sinuspersici]